MDTSCFQFGFVFYCPERAAANVLIVYLQCVSPVRPDGAGKHSFIMTDAVRLPWMAGSLFSASSCLKMASEERAWGNSLEVEEMVPVPIVEVVTSVHICQHSTNCTLKMDAFYCLQTLFQWCSFEKKKKVGEGWGDHWLAIRQDKIPPLLKVGF